MQAGMHGNEANFPIWRRPRAAPCTIYDDGLRVERVTYPKGRIIYYDYGGTGTSTEIGDRLGRVEEIRETSSSGTQLAAYSYNGTGRLVIADYPQPDVRLDLYQGTSGTYAGLDRYASAALATIVNSTFSGNSADYGGAMQIQNSVNAKTQATIVNTTVTLNTAAQDAGGIYNVNMSGMGNAMVLHNTIVAGNTSANPNFHNGWGGLNVGGLSSNNLISIAYPNLGITNGSTGNMVGTSSAPINPRIGALADNSGSTKTHALLFDSLAIDAGNNDVLDDFNLDFDQRGFGRLVDWNQDSNARVDIGAFEVALEELFT